MKRFKAWFKDCIKWAKEDRYFYHAELHGALGGNPRPKWRRWEPFFTVEWIWLSIPFLRIHILCHLKGHDPEDCSTCHPDHGDVHIVCKRCNEVIAHTQLY